MFKKARLILSLATLLIIQCSVASNNDDRIIQQFYNYVDVISRIHFDNMLDMLDGYFKQLIESVPQDQRGGSTEVLQQYVQKIDRARQSSTSAEEKEITVIELEIVIANVSNGLHKAENEDAIIAQAIAGIMELHSRLAIEDRYGQQKFDKASEQLRYLVSQEGEERNRVLFGILDSITRQNDPVARELLMKQFLDIKRNEFRN